MNVKLQELHFSSYRKRGGESCSSQNDSPPPYKETSNEELVMGSGFSETEGENKWTLIYFEYATKQNNPT